MTINAIANEIEKRVEQLEQKRKQIQEKLSYKQYKNEKEHDKILKERMLLDRELEKLRDMYRVYLKR